MPNQNSNQFPLRAIEEGVAGWGVAEMEKKPPSALENSVAIASARRERQTTSSRKNPQPNKQTKGLQNMHWDRD
jgi:hypothetical protein